MPVIHHMKGNTIVDKLLKYGSPTAFPYKVIEDKVRLGKKITPLGMMKVNQ